MPAERGDSVWRRLRRAARRGIACVTPPLVLTGHVAPGANFREADYPRIPPRDLPFGVPAWFGDDAWVRRPRRGTTTPSNGPAATPQHTLVWRAPPIQR